jgi:hypothetical protein
VCMCNDSIACVSDMHAGPQHTHAYTHTCTHTHARTHTHTQVKRAIEQLMCEGTCALDEDKLEQLEKLLPTKVSLWPCFSWYGVTQHPVLCYCWASTSARASIKFDQMQAFHKLFYKPSTITAMLHACANIYTHVPPPHTHTHTYTHRPVTLINTHNHTPGYSSQRHTHFATLASKELEMTVMCSSGVPAQCGSICACEQVRACARVCVCVRLPNAKACVLACEQVRACEEIRACVSVCWCVHACVFSLSYVALMDVPVPVCECKMRWCVWKLCARHTP